MHEIKGYDRTVQELFSGGSFGIDYYQREYNWQADQVRTLLDDLTNRFLEDYQEGTKPNEVAGYGYYFLGSIVVSQDGETRQVVDGQQRLTTLTLLLIYLHRLQKDRADRVAVVSYIFDDDFGVKKFKLDVPDRRACMEALFRSDNYNPEGHSDSVVNLVERYADLEEIFPAELQEEALPLFVYWVLRKVKLIEIVAYTEGDAYTIFEAMNDRGLSLTPTDMLKGYLLANIDDPVARKHADQVLRKGFDQLSSYGRDTVPDFFKTWIRARHAWSIRQRSKAARPEDFDLIGTEYHRWVRQNAKDIGLTSSDAFSSFVSRDLRCYAALYQRLLDATQTRTPGLESVRYVADCGFTLQHHALMAPVTPDDDQATAHKKAGLVADYLDCLLHLRLWNYKSNSYSSMQYATFLLVRDIRGLDIPALRAALHHRLLEAHAELSFEQPVRLNQFTGKAIHRMLARFSDWLERKAGEPGRYEDYIVRSGPMAYEIEHIWPNIHDRFAEKIPQKSDFEGQRNEIGGLILLPKKLNASLGGNDFADKRATYLRGPALAQSLHETFYQNNPGVLSAIKALDLPFKPYGEFPVDALRERSMLYSRLAAMIWSVDRLAMPGATGLFAQHANDA